MTTASGSLASADIAGTEPSPGSRADKAARSRKGEGFNIDFISMHIRSLCDDGETVTGVPVTVSRELSMMSPELKKRFLSTDTGDERTELRTIAPVTVPSFVLAGRSARRSCSDRKILRGGISIVSLDTTQLDGKTSRRLAFLKYFIHFQVGSLDAGAKPTGIKQRSRTNVSN
jgi:hypothetical protein